jgi:deazaflavin-dependent oxidoreductase (nitroreductase family)
VGLEDFRNALQGASEVELTVTGRKSGRESSRPVWFVEEGEKLFLLPLNGSGSNWYKNVLKTPTIGLAIDGAELRTDAKPITDAAAVGDVVERFQARYGDAEVKSYWPNPDAAVEVPLT